MTRTTNARLAGASYFLYLVAGIGAMAAAQSPQVRDLLNLLMPFCALLLGVTLYALTRDIDGDLAMIAMLCRVLEAAPGNGEIFFAVGNTIFCWLLIRGRLIPAALAWLGLLATAGLVILLLLQAGGMFGGRTNWSSPFTWLVWLPVLVFELTFAVWLLTKGVKPAAQSSRA
jgi:hypothetical protein